MKKIRLMIIAVIIIIIILIISILVLIKKNEQSILAKEQEDYLYSENNPGYFLKGLKPEKVKLDNEYASVEACIEKALSYAKENNDEAVYNLLNENYIKDKNISRENAKEEFKQIDKLRTNEIYGLVGTNYASYYIKAVISNNQNIYFNINWDVANSAFDIKLLLQKEYEEYIGKKIEDVKSKEEIIEKNSNNSIPYKYLAEDDIVEKYLLDYVERAIDFPDNAYNYVEEEYKKAKFGNVANFKQYIQNNTDIKDIYSSKNSNIEDYTNYMEYLVSVKDAGLQKYSKEENEGYTKYVCIDTFGNYYIFKVTSPMQYSVILDTYTIDLPEFVSKYNASKPEEKVILNINKFMLSINNKDYKYAYSLLADSFKQRNFTTLESFENYIKSNFFEKNEFEYVKFGDEANTYYTYEIKVKNKKGPEEKTKTFIMLLEKGTEFKLSFNI